MKYNISYEKDGVYQTMIVLSEHTKEELRPIFAEYRGISEDQIFGIRGATADDDRPGKPKVRL